MWHTVLAGKAAPHTTGLKYLSKPLIPAMLVDGKSGKFLQVEFNCKSMTSDALENTAPGLNFINVLHTAFVPADSESVKIY